MAEYYVGNISVSGARAPSFTTQPVGPVQFTIGVPASASISFVVSDPNHADALTFSISGTLPSTVSASFEPDIVQDAFTSGVAVLHLDYNGGGTASSANFSILADDGTGDAS